MTTLVLIWLGLCVVMMLLGSTDRQGSAGLPLAYFLGLSLIHTPGAMLYVNSQSWDSAATLTKIGFEQTVIGMIAFSTAVIVARYTASLKHSVKTARNLQIPHWTVLFRLATLYFGVGLFCFMSMQILSRIPSLGSVSAALGALMIVGACLRIWVARQSKNRLKYWQTIGLLPLLPLLTVVKDGFLGFGTYWLLSIASFILSQTKRTRLACCALAPIVAVVGLSVFVNYMAARGEIRSLIWYQQGGFGDRVEHVLDIFRNFQWLDLSNTKQREAIDGRLNQNVIVGIAVDRLRSGVVEYAAGTTITNMVIGLIPRALWPDKPAVGGGGTVVTQFTGVQFAEGTSVGAGQVLEFYVNFGTLGVIGGFVIFGWLIGRMDLRVIDSLSSGDQKSFVLYFLMCLALIQPGGNLLEIVVTVASAAIAGIGIGHLLIGRFTGGAINRKTPVELTIGTTTSTRSST